MQGGAWGWQGKIHDMVIELGRELYRKQAVNVVVFFCHVHNH